MILEINDLYAGYGKATIIRGVNLDVEEQAVIAILGRNGMGKTTLLRSICGLSPPELERGSVRLRGTEISGMPNYVVSRQGLSLVPQGRRIFGSLTVEENLRIADNSSNPQGFWNLARVFELFPQLQERRNQPGSVLSGGEQQMLAIGRALMGNPTLLLMDEPSEGLAPSIRDTVVDCILQLKSEGHTILLAEQNVDMALEVADDVAVIGESGGVEWAGKPTALRSDSALMRDLMGV